MSKAKLNKALDGVFGSSVRTMRADVLAVAVGGPGENFWKDGSGPDNQGKNFNANP